MDENCEILTNLRQSTVQQLNDRCLKQHLRASKKWGTDDLKKLVRNNWEMDEFYCYYESWMTEESYEICTSCTNLINQFKEQYQELSKTDSERSTEDFLDRIGTLEDEVDQLKTQVDQLKTQVEELKQSIAKLVNI